MNWFHYFNEANKMVLNAPLRSGRRSPSAQAMISVAPSKAMQSTALQKKGRCGGWNLVEFVYGAVQFKNPMANQTIIKMNYFTRYKKRIIVWWVGILVVFTALTLGFFFLSLYAAIPLAIYRSCLPCRKVDRSAMFGVIQYLGVVSLLIYLGFTGTISHMLEVLWKQEFAWLLGGSLACFYMLIIMHDYRMLSKITSEEV